MRITGETARAMSRYAHQVSAGRVYECQIGGDIGNGARIIDGNEQLVWLSRPREATAYYVGQIDAFRDVLHASDDLPADVANVRAEILAKPGRTVAEWYRRGVDVGTLRAARKAR